jgi:hypothetical protein
VIIDRRPHHLAIAELAKRMRVWLGKPMRRGWLVPAWALLAVAALGWATRARPLEPVWGTIADWVAGLSQAGALIFLAWQIMVFRADQSDRRQSEDAARRREHQAAARSVGVSVSMAAGQRILCEVFNGGSSPVHSATLRPMSISAAGELKPVGDAKSACPGGVLFPGLNPSRTEFEALVDAIGEKLAIMIQFGDPWGGHWQRLVDLDGSEIYFGNLHDPAIGSLPPHVIGQARSGD